MAEHTPRTGFLGFGEVGYHLAKGLQGEGFAKVLAYNNGARNRPPYADAFRKRAQAIGVQLVSTLEELATGDELIFSCVVPKAALQVAVDASAFLGKSHWFVDLNSASPMAKSEAAKHIREAGARYLDAAILTPAFRDEHRVQMYVCGDGAEEFQQRMSHYGMRIRSVPGEVGTCATIKMIRSLLTKGMVALLWETSLAIYKSGIEVNIFSEAYPAFSLDIGRFLRELPMRGGEHLARRSGELEHVSETLKTLGIAPIMADAAAERVHRVSGFPFQEIFEGHHPSDYREVLGQVITFLANDEAQKSHRNHDETQGADGYAASRKKSK